MKTPLYQIHQSLGARMAPFSGWDMPIQYEGILQEHQHTRQAASIFDTCHMGEFDLRGSTAEADLERLLTQNVNSLNVGQCRYGYLLREDGGVIDDLTVFKRADDHFFLVVNAGTRAADADWIKMHLSADTMFEDLSPHRAKLDVQGPTSRADMEAVFGCALPGLKYFYFQDVMLAGIPCTLSRTGYTGEWGYEIYFPGSETERMWSLLTEGASIKPAGLGARDTLRLEVGYPLYGHELGLEKSPVAAGRGLFMDCNKDFIGKPIVQEELQHGVPRYLAGLQLDSKRAAREGVVVLKDGNPVGEITSGSLAPSLGVAVAMAHLDAALCEPGTEVELDMRGKPLAASVVKMPFYKEGTARKTC